MWKDTVKRLLDNSPYFQRRRRLADAAQVEQWRRAGCPLPIPHPIKSQRIRDIAKRHGFQVLVETGTCLGDMVHATRDAFGAIHTIELSPLYAARSRARLKGLPHVTIHEGDSGTLLPQIVSALKVPALFWLDAHYSGGTTAQGAEHSPIARELKSISGGPAHGLLIDDVREFIGENGYPTIEELRILIDRLFPRYTVRIAENMIEALP